MLGDGGVSRSALRYKTLHLLRLFAAAVQTVAWHIAFDFVDSATPAPNALVGWQVRMHGIWHLDTGESE